MLVDWIIKWWKWPPVFITATDYQDFTFFIVLKISGRFIMVKDTIIEEKNCFSDDSARRFMQTIQQTSCNISNPDLSLHSSPSRP